MGKVQGSEKLVNKIIKKSVSTYFQERRVVLVEQNQIIFGKLLSHTYPKRTPVDQTRLFTSITKQNEVSEILIEENHPSICKIKENMNRELSFNFSETVKHTVGKIIDKLQLKKATDVDKISHKILKLAKRKTNYRPVSTLTVTSKIYEKISSQQLSNYFETFLINIYVLSGKYKAFRRFC